MRVRFAPSPTGYLHIGGARTALFNYLYAKSTGGKLLLRIDDTDPVRSKKEFEEDIILQLKVLGINWDEGPDIEIKNSQGKVQSYRQSERLKLYQAVAEKLLSQGSAYIDPDDQSIRLKYQQDEVTFNDKIYGTVSFPVPSLGPEPVIMKADGRATYHLGSVVDDLDMEISDVIRGQDHLTNTAKHVLILNALGEKLPNFAHLPLILGSDGSKLSKRAEKDPVLVRDFIKQGYLPEAINNFLALLGWSHPENKETFTIDEAAQVFSLDRIHKAGAIFDRNKLNWFNEKYFKSADTSKIYSYLKTYESNNELKLKDFTDEEIKTFQTEYNSISEIGTFFDEIFNEDFTTDPEKINEIEGDNGEKKELLKTFYNFIKDLPTEDGSSCYSKEQFTKICNNIKNNLKLSPKLLWQTLRTAIIGRPSGPDLKSIIPLIKRDILIHRISKHI